jgi:putative membrane protein
MKSLSAVIAGTGMCILFSCGGGNGSTDSVDSAKNANDSNMSAMKDSSSSMGKDSTPSSSSTQYSAGPVDKDDANFAVDAANGGMTEVAASQLAQNNATSQRVKDFATMMVQDHTKAGDELKKLAAAKSVTLPAGPSDKNQKKIDDLGKKTGTDFDKAYVKLMLNDHKDAVDLFKKEADKAKDADIKTFASKTLPTLEMHLDSIKAIAGKQ